MITIVQVGKVTCNENMGNVQSHSVIKAINFEGKIEGYSDWSPC